MMYETTTFNIAETIRAMEAGYDTVGSFRTFGFRPLVPRYQWHYSGTFYNVRTQSLFQQDGTLKPFQQRYGGTEAWPGDHVPAWKSMCVFEDNSPWLRQYDPGLMRLVIPRHLVWQSSQYQTVQMEQHHREFDWLAGNISDVGSLLVIGSRHGGIEYHLKQKYPQLRIVSVDVDPLPTNYQDCLIRGDSHSKEVQSAIVASGPFDAVFVDGDHSYDGVKLDWEFSKQLHPRKIFFHDHTNAQYHEMCGCHVDKLWAEIVAESPALGRSVSEKVVGCGWGGIGLVECEKRFSQ